MSMIIILSFFFLFLSFPFVGIRVFSSCTFFLTDGVADVNAPSLGEIQSIVESGGGTWITVLKHLLNFVEFDVQITRSHFPLHLQLQLQQLLHPHLRHLHLQLQRARRRRLQNP